MALNREAVCGFYQQEVTDKGMKGPFTRCELQTISESWEETDTERQQTLKKHVTGGPALEVRASQFVLMTREN